MQTKKIKICHIANSSSAVKFLLLPQLQFLQSLGYEVWAACKVDKYADEIENKGIKVKNISFSRNIFSFWHPVAFLQLFFFFKKEKFDVVHTHNPVPGFLGQLAAKFTGMPVIINTIHGFYFSGDTPSLKRKIFIFAERLVAKCSTLIFSQNREDVETAIKENICSSEKIKYLGNGINLEKFNSNNLPKDLGVPPGAKVIGIVARLVEEKGYLDLFEALEVVVEKFPDIFLLSVGPAEPNKKDGFDKSIVNKYNKIKGRVLFLGQRDDIDKILPAIDIFVLPSHREGFPRSLLEASAMQKPIIATNIRGCREAVEDGKTGILVPAKNPKELAKAIIYLLENPDVADELGMAARQKAIKEFDENLVFEKLKNAYADKLN
ncbi:MAG: glycosyltransferase family 4 protein [Candidatus Pacebacteria bacterium]|nr:glycosyltransferase family 4 protein [Candidatus Paceibacterota bacterium]